MKEPTLSWTKLDNGDTMIKCDDREIGVVSQSIIEGKWKWIMKPNFSLPFDLKSLLNTSYNNDIEAGRKLAKLWQASLGTIDIRSFIDRASFYDDFFVY